MTPPGRPLSTGGIAKPGDPERCDTECGPPLSDAPAPPWPGKSRSSDAVPMDNFRLCLDAIKLEIAQAAYFSIGTEQALCALPHTSQEEGRSNTGAPIDGREAGEGTVHQVVGFLAVGAAGAALLHAWDLPRIVSSGFMLVSLLVAALIGSTQALDREAPSQPLHAGPASRMPATEGRIAPMRRPSPRTDTAVAW